MIKNIIFDLGGVLIKWNPYAAYETVFKTALAREHFFKHVTTFPWNEAQDAGRTIAEANDILTSEQPHYKREIHHYYDRWEEDMLGGAIEGTVEILKDYIASDYSVFALTNWSAETFPVARKKFPFLSWFEGILVSGEEMMKKPDPRIYHLICNRYDLLPEESVFIDDSLKNIKGASECNIHAIHFTSPENLKMELSQIAPIT